MNKSNQNNQAGVCIVSFSFRNSDIFVFEYPDENIGYYDGWIIAIDHAPYYYSVAGGSERICAACIETYAQHVGIKHLDDNPYEYEDEDLAIEFEGVFHAAMLDAGFVMLEGGGYDKSSKQKKGKKK